MEATAEDFNDATWHHQAQLEELEQTYQQLLAQDPGYEAWINGLCQKG